MFAAVSGHNPNKDYEVSQPPEDSISKVGELITTPTLVFFGFTDSIQPQC